MPIYRVNTNAPCEVQMYTQQKNYRHCNSKHIFSTDDFWIALNRPHSWVYSIAADQQITIDCDGRHEQKITIRNTGRIALKEMQIDNAGHDGTVTENNIRNGHKNVSTGNKYNTLTRPKNNNEQ